MARLRLEAPNQRSRSYFAHAAQAMRSSIPLSEKRKLCYTGLGGPRRFRLFVGACRGFSKGGAQKFGGGFLRVRPSQTLEIPQNRQRNVWKNLEKSGSDLETLGRKACPRGPARGASCAS